jgi:hypothetical protein
MDYVMIFERKIALCDNHNIFENQQECRNLWGFVVERACPYPIVPAIQPGN